MSSGSADSGSTAPAWLPAAASLTASAPETRAGSSSTAIPPASTASAIEVSATQRTRSVCVLAGPRARSAAKPRRTSAGGLGRSGHGQGPDGLEVDQHGLGPGDAQGDQSRERPGTVGRLGRQQLGGQHPPEGVGGDERGDALVRGGAEVEDDRLRTDPNEPDIGKGHAPHLGLRGQLTQSPVDEVQARLPPGCPDRPLDLPAADSRGGHPLTRAPMPLELTATPHQLRTHPGQQQGCDRTPRREGEHRPHALKGGATQLVPSGRLWGDRGG